VECTYVYNIIGALQMMMMMMIVIIRVLVVRLVHYECRCIP